MTKQQIANVESQDHRIGHLHASAILIEYGDFECGACAKAAPIMDDLLHEFGSDLCFVFRHFPIVASHPHANLAAIAAEAANEQDKFWAMHHALFKNSASLSRDLIIEKAREMKLDMELFELDLLRPDLMEKVKKNFESGVECCVTSTPSFFINGEKYLGDVKDLRRAIQDTIDRGIAQFSL